MVECCRRLTAAQPVPSLQSVKVKGSLRPLVLSLCPASIIADAAGANKIWLTAVAAIFLKVRVLATAFSERGIPPTPDVAGPAAGAADAALLVCLLTAGDTKLLTDSYESKLAHTR